MVGFWGQLDTVFILAIGQGFALSGMTTNN